MILIRRLLLVVFSFLLFADLFIWGISGASSHIIPAKTISSFKVTALILLALIFISYKYIRPKDT